MRFRTTGRLLALGLAVGSPLALGACGSGQSASGTTRSTTSTFATGGTSTTSTTTKVRLTGPSLATIEGSKTVEVGGKVVVVPTDHGAPIDPQIDDGQQIVISAGGFLPARLYSTPGMAIVWTNLTEQPQQITFDALAVTSPVIFPGGTFRYSTPGVGSESIAYHSDTGLAAVVTILPAGI
jgi:hypothetical protein